jgi:23S rRNA (pseudouridine1915-N3)-methyltransferase
LAAKIQTFALTGISNISFIISDDFNLPNESFSISHIDMDMGLKTSILFEQIYRAYRINNKHAYHK